MEVLAGAGRAHRHPFDQDEDQEMGSGTAAFADGRTRLAAAPTAARTVRTARRHTARTTDADSPETGAQPAPESPGGRERLLVVVAWDLEGADLPRAADWLRDQDPDLALVRGLDTCRVYRVQEVVARHIYPQLTEARDRCAAVVISDDGPLVAGLDEPPLAAPWPFAAQLPVRLRGAGGGRSRPVLRVVAAAPCPWAPQRADTEARWLGATAAVEPVMVAGTWPDGERDALGRVLAQGGLSAVPVTPSSTAGGACPGSIHVSTALLPAVISLTAADDAELDGVAPRRPLLLHLDQERLHTVLAAGNR
ncbi:hypothetical protein ACIQC7_34825 [Kitasatospora sp. NPDC088556]|uniref:hypothetical protein n=1 Tax=Kitasatospora sp. NPDC088556 TaxID=3364076 RepID=UPI003809CBCB